MASIFFDLLYSLVWFEFALIQMYFNFSMPPNIMALYPNWLILYVLDNVIPMIMLLLGALKILIKSGRDLQRAFDIDYYRFIMIVAELFQKKLRK